MSSKPHVLIIANFSNRTGFAWNNIYRLYDVIARTVSGAGLGVCVSFATIEGPVTTVHQDIPIESFEYDPIGVPIRDVARLISNIRKHNIQYVYTTDLPPYHWTYPLMRIMGVQVIVNHCRVSVENPYPAEPERGIRRVFKRTIARIDFLNVNRIYCVSQFVKNRLVQKNCVPESKLIRILNGISLDTFTCEAKSLSGPVKIFIGARSVKHKGVQVLFEAANLLVTKLKTTNFCIDYAGNGPDYNFLKTLVTQYGIEQYVNFLGELKDTRDQVCNSDIIVVPSIWGDACPSTISEALAAGKPLIASRAGGIPEIVGDEGNAILIEPGDANMIAEKLYELINDPELMRSYGERARSRAISALGDERYYAEVLSEIKSDFNLSD